MGSCLISILIAFVLFPLIFGIRTISSMLNFILRGRKNSRATNQQQEKPISQDDRIIEYKKREFETTSAEDVEFEEIKKDDNKQT